METNMQRRDFLARLAAGSAAAATWPGANAADPAYPSSPIRFVVPFPPGGATDNTARLVTQHLAPILGQACVIDNRSGANGRIGAEAVARAKPDGYTLLLGGIGPLTIAPHLEKVPYDPETDFTPISCLVTYDTVLIVNPALPIQDVQGFIAYLRSGQPVSFGSSGLNGPYHMAGELFKSLAKVDMLHVPYRGDGVAIVDLISGNIQAMFTSTSASISHIKAGSVRAIAAATSRRIPMLPDLKTVAEQGVTGYAVDAWAGLFGPGGLSPDVVQTLYAAVSKAFATQAVRNGVLTQGGNWVASSPTEFRSFLQAESARWGTLIRERKLKAE